MNDLIKELASDPSCLLAITPEVGGSWLSPFRTRQPRNFADNSMAWTNAKTALDTTDQSHDFTFEIEFKCVETNAVYIFASDGSNDFIRVFMSSGEIIVSTALLSTASGGSTQFSAGSDSTNRHALTVKMIENTITALIDGEIVYTRENLVRNAIEISAPRSNAGYVYKISITDDTTGEIVWQAAYSDLYDTSNPWPSPVPRNFAEEPMTWWDEKTTAPAIAEDDCEFFIRYRLDGYPEGSVISQIFYHNSQNGSINIAFAGNGTGGNYSVIRLTGAGAFVIPLDRVRQLGEHTIRIQRIGQTVTIEFDGEIVAISTGAEKVAVYSTTAPVSDFDGVIFETYWKSLTTGRTIWSYPSEAERVRLITKTNVRADRGAFEAADETQPARIDTALDLRGKVSSYTLFVEFDAAALENESDNYCKQELAGQGASKGSIPSPLAVNYNKQLNVDTLEYRLEVSVDIAGARHLSKAILPGHLAGRNSVVAVVELMDDKTRLSIYHCGVLLKSEIVDGIPKMDGYACPDSFALMDNRNGLWINYYGKIHSCLLFDRALSAEEITLYSKIANS